MSETIVRINAEFVTQDKAVFSIALLKKHINTKLCDLIEYNRDETGNIKNIDDGWFLSKTKRTKNFVYIKVIGPPSGGELDGMIEWLTKLGAKDISGDIVCTLSDYAPSPFHFVDGVSINPSINIRSFLKNFSSGEGVNQRNGVGMTPLHRAAEIGNIELADALLNLGAEINDLSKFGSPLSYAIFNNRNEMVKFLFEKGVKVPIDLDHQIRDIDNAIKNCNKKMVKFLLEKGYSLGCLKNEFNLNQDLLINTYTLSEQIWEQEATEYRAENRTPNPNRPYDELVDKYNSNNIAPIYGGGIWDRHKMRAAVDIGKRIINNEITIEIINDQGFYPY